MNEGDLLRQSLTEPKPIGGDLVEQATKVGWLHPFAEGQWLYSGFWVRLFRRLQALYVSRLCQRLQFEEWLFPRLIPEQALVSFELTHYKPGMLFGVEAYKLQKGCAGMLDPVQCVALYHYFRQRFIPAETLPLKIVECLGGWTWRNEQDNELCGPIRAREFARVESVFIGNPQQVRELRNAVEDEITKLLTDLRLSWRVVVGAGCMEIPTLLRATEEATTASDVPVHDIEILLDNNQWLEISGCTVEGDHLVTAFEICQRNGAPLWSGCCGLGMNRLLSAMFLQHGFDLSAWPYQVKALIEDH